MRAGIVAKSLGALLLILGLGALGPLGADAIAGYPLWPWLTMLGAIVGAGLGLLWLGRRARPEDMGLREGIAVTSLTWMVSSLLAAIGIWLASPEASYLDGWFEAMSGFTTTGATIFGEDRPIEELTPGVHLWRAQAQWMGGIGIVVISLALMPLLVGGTGFAIYRAEVPGIDTDRLAPRLRDTARILFHFYLGMTVAVFVALLACGVGPFDAICHALTTVSTGGFSTFDDSVEGLGSAAAEWVLIGGMLAGGVNFGLLLHALSGRPGRLWRSPEVRLYLALLIGFGILLIPIVGLETDLYDGAFHDLVRDCLFQSVAIGTSTGYATGYDTVAQSWGAWPSGAEMLLLILMIGGGCAGSTAGGLKLVRLLVAWKAAKRELRRYLEPARITPISIGGHPLRDQVVLQVGTYFFIYTCTWALGTFGFTLFGTDLVTAGAASISCLSNIGPALGEVGPHKSWSHLGAPSHVLAIVLMLLGRLELFGVLLTLRLKTWRR